MENKNKVWFEKFESGNFENLYYVEAGHAYYDLVVQEYNGELNAIPVPIFAKHFLNTEITGMEPDFGHWERVDVKMYLNEKVGENYDVIDTDGYVEKKREFQVRKEDAKLLANLTEEEKDLLESVENEGLVLEYGENQFGERIVLAEVRGNREYGFELYVVTCHSTTWLGLGICQCNNHEYYELYPISAKKVLALVKQKRGA